MKEGIACKKESDGVVRVSVGSKRIQPRGSYLSAVFTDEGVIFDHISKDGKIIGSWSTLYDDFVERLS